MRPEHAWFKPEQLRRYYFAYELIALTIVVAAVGLLAVTGVLTAMRPWVLTVGGAVALLVFGYLTWWIPAFYRESRRDTDS